MRNVTLCTCLDKSNDVHAFDPNDKMTACDIHTAGHRVKTATKEVTCVICLMNTTEPADDAMDTAKGKKEPALA